MGNPKTTTFSSGDHYLVKMLSKRRGSPDEKEVGVGWRKFCQLCHTGVVASKRGIKEHRGEQGN
jgi:hypothetical protein